MASTAALKLAAAVVLATSYGVSAEAPCGNCHRRQTSEFAKTPMAQALLKPIETTILAKTLTFQDGPWTYRISRENDRSTYTVSDGKNTITGRLLWAFGFGAAGQTYVYEYDGALHESRVSYYTRLQGLDLTMGAIGSKPASLATAAGRKMQNQDVAECFGCHSTGSSPRAKFTMDSMVPGVQCGACHEGVNKHELSMASNTTQSLPPKLARLNTEEVSESCGRCHRTWEQISVNGPRGVANVRFQPYRLTNSKCYDAEDRRISCVACHDPHRPLETQRGIVRPPLHGLPLTGFSFSGENLPDRNGKVRGVPYAQNRDSRFAHDLQRSSDPHCAQQGGLPELAGWIDDFTPRTIFDAGGSCRAISTFV